MSDDHWGWDDDPNAPRPGAPRNTPPDPAWAAMDTSPTSAWSATLDDLAVQGHRERSRARARRRIIVGISAAAVVVIAAVVATVVILGSGDSSSGSSASATSTTATSTTTAVAAGPVRVPDGWCATGTQGAVTTVSKGSDQKTPVGVVATFLAAAIDDKSATAAHATMSQTAVVPSVAQLQQWISALPASTDGWCARVTTTDSTARLLVNLRARTDNGIAQVGDQDTFYVSATGPERWEIDAIVSDDGNRP